jgi:hypothetical protein
MADSGARESLDGIGSDGAESAPGRGPGVNAPDPPADQHLPSGEATHAGLSPRRARTAGPVGPGRCGNVRHVRILARARAFAMIGRWAGSLSGGPPSGRAGRPSGAGRGIGFDQQPIGRNRSCRLRLARRFRACVIVPENEKCAFSAVNGATSSAPPLYE